MSALIPVRPKIYHIVHVDRLPSIIAAGGLWSDAGIRELGISGTSIGMDSIKNQRLNKSLSSHPGLHIGDCVPFYFCPRSVMLYVIARQSSKLEYRGGERLILHLEADLYESIAWARTHRRRWAFTTTNAAANYAEDFADIRVLNRIDWNAVHARDWRAPSTKASKQAEFLVEGWFPWSLIKTVGCQVGATRDLAEKAIMASSHRPHVRIRLDWYYSLDDRISR